MLKGTKCGCSPMSGSKVLGNFNMSVQEIKGGGSTLRCHCYHNTAISLWQNNQGFMCVCPPISYLYQCIFFMHIPSVKHFQMQHLDHFVNLTPLVPDCLKNHLSTCLNNKSCWKMGRANILMWQFHKNPHARYWDSNRASLSC